MVFVLLPQFHRFNGAATLSLRKCGTRKGSSSGTTSFNGAATLSLRKFLPSSMLSFISRTLQWGRNFIVAETYGRRQAITDQPSASMGPQLYRCGNLLVASQLVFRLAASMGPQLYRCGNHHVLPTPIHINGASMGPQLYRCGNTGRHQETPTLNTKLQWGRNFIVAETWVTIRVLTGTDIASMGPQLYRCGNVVLEDFLNHYEKASMGP